MPGLRLTLPQAQRLWGLDESTCHSLLNFLVNAKFLVRIDEGPVYARLSEGAVPLPWLRMAKVDPGLPTRNGDRAQHMTGRRRAAG